MESCNSYSQSHFPTDHFRNYYENAAGYPPPPYRSVHKFPAKNVITKRPIAPMPPTPPRIYKVDPVDFKDVVQKLTGAQEFQPRRLQEVAPPPLDLSPPLKFNLRGNEGEKRRKLGHDNVTVDALSPLGFTLSPASIAWCSTVLMSPRTRASLDPSAVV